MCPPPTSRIDADDVDDIESGSEKTPALLTAKLRRTQRLLRRQTARLEATIEAVQHGFAMFDSRDRLITCNLAFLTQYNLPVSCARTGTSLQRILEARVTAGTHSGAMETFVIDHLALARSAHGISRTEQLPTGERVSVGFRPMADGGFVWTQKAAASQVRATDPVVPVADEPSADFVDHEVIAQTGAAEPELEAIEPEPAELVTADLHVEAPEVPDAQESGLLASQVTEEIPTIVAEQDTEDLMVGFGDTDEPDTALPPDLDAAAVTVDAVLDETEAGDLSSDVDMLAADLLVESAAHDAEEALDTAIDDATSALAGLEDLEELIASEDDTTDASVELSANLDAPSLDAAEDPMTFDLPPDEEQSAPADPLAAWADDLAEDTAEDPIVVDLTETDAAAPAGISVPALFTDLDSELRRALGNNELSLVYQPILSMQSQAIVGFEALLRWIHPVHGELAAGQFMTLAESTSQIVPLGAWVLEHALAEAAHWPDRYRVAINVSPGQFRDGDLAGVLPSLLDTHGLVAERVELEFTESLFLVGGAANLERLNQLRELGIKLTLDDFCAGQSSIQDVMAFAFDRIKVDGDYIRLADADGPAAGVVRAFAELGQWLGIPASAEGIETAEQLRAVHALGFSEAQGFLIARPMNRDGLMGLIGAEYRDADDASAFDFDALSATA